MRQSHLQEPDATKGQRKYHVNLDAAVVVFSLQLGLSLWCSMSDASGESRKKYSSCKVM